MTMLARKLKDCAVGACSRIRRNLFERGILILLILILLFLNSYYSVDQGFRDVVTRSGKVIAVSDPGPHFKIPCVDSVHSFKIRTQKKTLRDLKVYSKDGYPGKLLLSVNFSLNPEMIREIYEKLGDDYYGYVIEPQLYVRPQNTFGRFTVVETIRNRGKLMQIILKDMQEYFTPMGILFSAVNIEDIDFSQKYDEQAYKREKVSADTERVKAAGLADAAITMAKAKAETIRIAAQAEADAIAIKKKALGENPVVPSSVPPTVPLKSNE